MFDSTVLSIVGSPILVKVYRKCFVTPSFKEYVNHESENTPILRFPIVGQKIYNTTCLSGNFPERIRILALRTE